jgi:acetyl esterase/lipase
MVPFVKQRTYLAASAAGALGVVNAHRPIVRRSWAATLAFAAGWMDSELPLAAMAAHAGLVVAGARRGLLRTRRGQVATALNVAAMAGLGHLYAVSRKTDAVLEGALQEELGRDYRDRIVYSPYSGGGPATVRRFSVPFAVARMRGRYVAAAGRDIAYGEAGRRNHLDVWRRVDLPADARAPVLVQVHGGAWVMGEKHSQALPLLSHLTQRGWVCVSTTYRLSPRATWPDLIVDIMKTLAWTKDNIARFGGDPGFVAITGGSAGGHLSALAALAAGDPHFQPGFESADTTVQAAVPLYGVYDWLNRHQDPHDQFIPWIEQKVIKQSVHDAREVFDQASPIGRVHAGAPPFFVVHGANDSLVKTEQARAFAEALRKTSQEPVVYAELPAAQHAFDTIRSPRAVHTAHAIERFLGVAYGEHQRDRAAVAAS